jgi:hypothetical protein
LQCRNCGDVVDPERVALGYDYCLEKECQQRCLKPVLLAAVGVNKAADQYLRAEEVLLPTTPPSTSSTDEDDLPQVQAAPRRPPAQKRLTSTLERLREKERELDAALGRSYERFCRGEVTAKEMDRERDRLVRTFNQVVMGENIRYRSMLRTGGTVRR